MQPSAQRPPFLEKEKLGKKEKQNKQICWYFIAKKVYSAILYQIIIYPEDNA